jgi:SOS response regulatory protein OraA/RecX
MSKGSATAIIAIVLILATVAAAGLYSSGKLTGAQTTVPSESSINWTLISLIILIIVVAGMLFYLFSKSKFSTKKHSKKFNKRIVLPLAFAIIVLILAGITLIFGLPQLAKFAAPAPATPTEAQITLNPVADAVADENYPSKIWDDDTLSVMAAHRWTYIKFNLSSIPVDYTITSAYLQLYATSFNSFGVSRTYELYNAGGAWAEGSLTWNNKPALGTKVTSALIGPPINTWQRWDVTSSVQAKYNGETNNGWVITDPEATKENSYATFVSKEGTSAYKPQLIIKYIPEAIPPTVSITSPAKWADISGITTVSAVASDNVGVTKVEFYLDYSPNPNFTDPDPLYQWNFDTTKVSPGSHSIQAKAYDAVGNVGTSEIIPIHILQSQCTGTHAKCNDVDPKDVSGSGCALHSCAYDSARGICTGTPHNCSVLTTIDACQAESIYNCIWTGAAQCSIVLTLSSSSVKPSAPLTTTAKVSGGSSCGDVSICPPAGSGSVYTKSPDAAGIVSTIFTAPSVPNPYTYTAALIKSATCTTPEPSDFVDIKPLTVSGDTTPPAQISNLATSSPTANSMTLTWTAPGDDGTIGTASQYDIRYATSALTESNWNDANTKQVTGEPAPAASGTSQSFIITGLQPSTTYYFGIKTADEVLNWATISNSPSGTTASAAAGQCNGTHTVDCSIFTTSQECSSNSYHGGGCKLDSSGKCAMNLNGAMHKCTDLAMQSQAACEAPGELKAGCTWQGPPPAPSCLGNVVLSFSPNPVNVSPSTTSPIASSLSNCTDKVVSFYPGTSCPSSGSPNVPITPFAVLGGGTGPNNCTILADGKGCPGYAFATSTNGSYPYVACIDKDGEGDYSDTGEQGSATLVVTLPSQKLCGNGNVDIGEDCDDTNLNGKSCTNLGKGYTGGNLTCTSACKFDESGCIGPPVPPCTGDLNLTFDPTLATINHQVTAKVSGLTNCDGNTATFNCTSGSCTYSGTGCTLTFNAPNKAGTYSCKATVSSTPVKSAIQSLNVVACIIQNPVLTIEPPTFQKGAKGDALLYMATIKNSNTCGSTFKLNVTTCLDKWTCDLSDTTLNLDEGEGADAILAITSPTSTDVGIGSYTHYLMASTVGNSSYNSTVDVNYRILKSCDRKNPTLKVAKVSQSGSIGQERTYSIKITNLDLCSSYYALDLSCETGWNCSLDTPDIYLLDGESADIAATLMPETSTTAGGHNFILTAVNSLDETKTANATLIYNVTGLNANQSTYDQMWGKWKPNDGSCDTKLGENISNSYADCAPPVEVTPVCGNNIVETGEDCDGSSDSRCPSLCNADCTCPFIIGDGICDSVAGETSAISSDCAKKASSISLVILLVAIFGAVGGVGYYFMKRRGMLGGLAATHGVETATPGVDLGTAVNSMLSEGYNPDEIHSSLEAGGWSHGKIESAMASAQTDQEALGKLAEQQGVAAPVEKAKASKYVKKCLAEGYDPTQIRTAMISSGWPTDAVDGVISKQTAKHIQSHAEKAGVSEPSDDTHALNEYVKKEMNEGHTKQDITKVLKKAGWSDSDIKGAFGG